RASDDVHLDLEPHPRHPDGLADAVLLVDDERLREHVDDLAVLRQVDGPRGVDGALEDRKSTRLNSSHVSISYAVFCSKTIKIQVSLGLISGLRHELLRLRTRAGHDPLDL